MKAELGKAALALSPKVDNRLQIARGAPNGFLDMARSGFAPLAQLVRGQATLVDDVLTVTGVAADNDKRQGAFAATQNLPKGVRLGGVKIEGPLGPTAQEAEAIRVKAEAERLAAEKAAAAKAEADRLAAEKAAADKAAAAKAEADRLAAEKAAADKAAADKAAAAKAEADRLAAENVAADKAAAAKAEADRLAAEKAAADKAAAAKAEADRLVAEKAAADKAAAAKAEADRLAAEKAAAEKAAAERLAAEKAAAEKAIADKAAAKSAPYKAPAAQIQQGGCVRPASGALLAGRVLFASGSARLNEEGQQVAHEIATMLKACSQFSVEVRGYTDSVGDAESNQRLARRRANALLNALTEQGVAKTRFVAESYGEGNPIGDNDTEEGRAQNRRIEILVK
jgi:outer membrane protein OmpA-like peptidoglycan-associated protein